MTLDEWQENVLQAAMGERSDGHWAARLVGLSTPRQNGKSQLIVARALAGILLFEEETILCSAHQTDTAREVFQRLLDIIEANPTVERRVDSVMRAINREHIRFKSGQVIRIKARSIAAGRGFSCDCLLLDEAQILGASAWASILPTMSARENPQAWLLGTPPTPADDGEVFSRLRQAGLAEEPRMSWVEWSAEEDDDIDDPLVWAKANPALGTRIMVEAVESERASMTEDQFSMERLGIWSRAVSHRGVLPAADWQARGEERSIAVDRFALGVEIGPDLAWASVAFAGLRVDGGWHFELDEDQHTKGRGVAWLVPHLEYLTEHNSQIRAVVVDVAGPIKTLLEERSGRWFFKDTRLEVTPVTVAGLGSGCAQVLNGIVTGGLHHIGQPQFTAAALAAGKRPLGDTGMWVWSRKSADSDITPIQAATLALIGAQNTRTRKPTRTGAGRRVVTV